MPTSSFVRGHWKIHNRNEKVHPGKSPWIPSLLDTGTLLIHSLGDSINLNCCDLLLDRERKQMRKVVLGDQRRGQFSLHRLEGLTDGIYAIAMTLLVLSLPLPEVGGTSSEGDIANHFIQYIDLFGSYALSFLLLGNFWIIQLKIFKYIKASCIPHLWANLGGLLVVCLIPFTSSLIGYHNHTFTANLFFHLNIFLISLFFLLQCKVLLMNPETISDDYDKAAIRRVIKINMILPLVSISGVLISFFSPTLSTLVYIVVPFFTIQLRNRVPLQSKEGNEDL